MKRGPGLVIFDLDGTLVDTAPDITACANAVLRDEGRGEEPLAAMRGAIGLGAHELFRRLLAKDPPDDAALERMVERFKALYAQNLVRQSRPFEGVRESLEGPLKDVAKAVVTNKPHALTVRLLAELGLERHFKRVIGMHSGFPPKPDPAAVLDVMGSLGFLPSETLLVGDSAVDYRTAQNAGVDFAWVSYGYEEAPPAGSVRAFACADQWKEIALWRS